jgi:hypothetical protein
VTAIFPEQRVATRDRLDQIRSLAPDQVEAGLAWLARNDPLIFDATVQAALTWDDGTPAIPESEPYCVVCRGRVGLFAGQEAGVTIAATSSPASSSTQPPTAPSSDGTRRV